MADGVCLGVGLWFAWAGFHYEQKPHLSLAGPVSVGEVAWTPPAPRAPSPEPTREELAATASTLPPEPLPPSSPLPPPPPPKLANPPRLLPRPSPQHTTSLPASGVQSSPSRASPLAPRTVGLSFSQTQSSPPPFSPLQASPAAPTHKRKFTPSPLRESMVASYTPEGSPTGVFMSEIVVANGAREGKVGSEIPLIEL